MISCKDAVSRLYAYLDRHLGQVPESEVEEHLKLCRHCCGELEFAKQVRAKLRQGSAEAPTEVRSRLETFLEELKGQRRARG